MECWGTQNFLNCQLGDKRLNKRALKIGKALGDRFGQPLSMVFPEEKLLKRTDEFFANPQTKFNKITQPHHQKTSLEAATILRWDTYRWHIEEYHKILKSGCQVENYRLAATSMQALLGFLTIIAVELLRVTYLHRTQPNAPAQTILCPVKLEVLKAKSTKLPKLLTVAWAVETVARLGGYLEHRKKTPIGIQVIWRGWLKLSYLCEGWELALKT